MMIVFTEENAKNFSKRLDDATTDIFEVVIDDKIFYSLDSIAQFKLSRAIKIMFDLGRMCEQSQVIAKNQVKDK